MHSEKRPSIRRVAANKLKKQSLTAEEGWSSSLGVGRDANNLVVDIAGGKEAEGV